jgi:CBS domain-containing protein
MQAKDVMTTNVISVTDDTTIRDACLLLLENGITGMPVVNADGRLAGLISEFGLLEALYNPRILNDPIRTYMTRAVMTVDENEPLSHVATLFLLHRIRRLPVVRNADANGRIVGIISRRDLLRTVVSSNEPLTCPPTSSPVCEPAIL